MSRHPCLIVGGLATLLIVYGIAFGAAKNGFFTMTLSTVYENDYINVTMVPQVVPAIASKAVVPSRSVDMPVVGIITMTDILSVQLITKTILVEKPDTSVADSLSVKLVKVYQEMSDRDAAYHAKLQDAYNQLANVHALLNSHSPDQAAATPQQNPASRPVDTSSAQPTSHPTIEPAVQPTSVPTTQRTEKSSHHHALPTQQSEIHPTTQPVQSSRDHVTSETRNTDSKENKKHGK